MRTTNRFFIFAINISMLIASALGAAGFFGQFGLWPELLGHFRLLWIALLATIVMLGACLRQRLVIIPAIVLVLIAAPVLQLYLGKGNPPDGKSTRIRLLQMNIWGGKNRAYDAVLSEITKDNPDVVGLSEVTPAWIDRLGPKLKAYKYSIVEPQHGGIALYSKLPMKGRVNYFGDIKRPRIDAQITVGGQKVTLIFAHPVIPMKSPPMRNDELSLLAQEAQNGVSAGPCILAGDLNCTPWSFYFEKLLSDGKLNDTERGFGPQPSWNIQIKALLLPIDHCLVSSDIFCLNRCRGSYVGSDHLPVIADLLIPTHAL